MINEMDIKLYDSFVVDSNETELKRIKNTYSSKDMSEILITNKRIYVNKKQNKTSSKLVVDIDTVQYIDEKHSSYYPANPIIAFLFLLIPLFGIVLLLNFPDNFSGIIVTIVGALMFLVAAILVLPRHKYELIIGSTSCPLSVRFDYSASNEVMEIKRLIFKTLDKRKQNK